MARANSGAGGNPDPTFGRCTIFYTAPIWKKGCCVCGKGEWRGKGGERGVCGWRVDLLVFLVDVIRLCVVFHWGWRVFNFGRGRAVDTFVLYFSFWCSNLQSPIKAKQINYHLDKIGCGRQPPPDDYRVLPLFIYIFIYTHQYMYIHLLILL